MVDQTPDDDLNSRIAEKSTATPRWVKVFGLIALVVAVVFVILMFRQGPDGRGHTPSRHFGGQAP